MVQSCTVRRPANELYAFWRNPTNLAPCFKHPVEITRQSDLEYHWRVSAPHGHFVEWDSTIVHDEPGESIAWRSREDADVPNAGSVRFTPAPGDEGTEVRVMFEYVPPGGTAGSWLAKLTRDDADQQAADLLRRFKALFEAGEIPTTDGQPVGSPQREKRSAR